MELDKLFEDMWQDYLALNPLAKTIYDLFVLEGEEVINDHIALRTYRHPKCGIQKLAKIFLDNGYSRKDDYIFEKKKLYAEHFEHSDPKRPKIFISELKIEELSSKAQSLINGLIDQMDEAVAEKDNFLFSGRHWNLDSTNYQNLLKESEYAGWMSAFGFRPNHFTVSVNFLNKFNSLEKINEFLKSKNIALNTSGGEIKGTPSDLLEQSSTLANKAQVKFSDKELQIPSCYYEFAKRYPDSSGGLYQGFIAASADKIFESTDTQS